MMRRIILDVTFTALLFLGFMQPAWAAWTYGPKVVTGTLDGQTVECSGLLTTNGTTTVSTGANATLKSVTKIIFKPGFHAKNGSTFSAEIRCACPTKVWDGDYTIASQADLEALGQYTKINGNLKVKSTGSTALNGLECLSEITGNLSINNTHEGPRPLLMISSIETIDGLSNLRTIGGGLSFNRTRIKNFNGLRRLEAIGGSFYISDAYELKALSGFNRLISIGQNFRLSNSGYVSSVSGFNALSTIGNDVTLFALGSLTSINGFDKWDGVINGNFTISRTRLENLKQFSNLTMCIGDMMISNNSFLTNLNLDSLCSVGANSIIENNENLCPVLCEDLRLQVAACSGSTFIIKSNDSRCDNDDDGMSDQWELDHGLDIYGDDSQLDNDGDGFVNSVEYVIGTQPGNSQDKPNPGNYYQYDALGRITNIVRIQ
ncbi:3-coathanger stack domain-containing protein [Desulfatiferula olefinivorans]